MLSYFRWKPSLLKKNKIATLRMNIFQRGSMEQRKYRAKPHELGWTSALQSKQKPQGWVILSSGLKLQCSIYTQPYFHDLEGLCSQIVLAPIPLPCLSRKLHPLHTSFALLPKWAAVGRKSTAIFARKRRFIGLVSLSPCSLHFDTFTFLYTSLSNNL